MAWMLHRQNSQPTGAQSPTVWWCDPRAVTLIILGYCLFNLLYRGFASPILGTDDMSESVLVQELRAGYMMRQPPLYEWLLYSVQQVVGPSIWSFQSLKYTLVALSGVFLYGIARLAMTDRKLAAIAVFSLTLLYQIGFNLHEGVTHTVVLMAGVSGTLFFFLRVALHGRWFDVLGLGLFLGVGALAKHSFYLVPVGLLCAAVTLPYWRVRLRPVPLLLACGVALVLYLPYLVWFLERGQSLVSSSLDVMVVETQVPHWEKVLSGEFRLAKSLVGFSMPFLALFLLFFGADLWRAQRSMAAIEEPAQSTGEVARFLGRYMGVLVVLTAMAIVVTGATYIKERHMHPILMLLPLWCFAVAGQVGLGLARLRWFLRLIIVLAGVVVVVRLPGFFTPDEVLCGSKCRQAKPFDRLAERLKAWDGTINEATIVSLDSYTGGNLRAFIPSARHVIASFRPSSPPRAACFVVWEAKKSEVSFSTVWQETPFARRHTLADGDILDGEMISVNWPHLWLEDGYRTSYWGVVRLRSSAAVCQ